MTTNSPIISKDQISALLIGVALLMGLYIHESASNTLYEFTAYGLIVLFFYFYTGVIAFGKNQCQLSTKILEERTRSCKKSGGQWIFRVFEKLYEPSLVSFISISSVVLLLNFISHVSSFSFWGLSLTFETLNFDTSNHFQNLIAVHAGIGTIIFALLIFIAESLRDDESKDKARVLLRESLLYPLAIAEIITFFNFLWWKDINQLSIVPIILVGLFAIYSLSKLIYILLNVHALQEKRLALLRDRVKKSISLAIDERLGNNYLINHLGENKIELTYTPLSERDTENYLFFNALKTGVVIDIDLCLLDKIAELLEEEANKNGLSFYENKLRPPEENISGSESTQAQSPKATYAKADKYHFGLAKKYHDRIDQDHKTLIRVHKSVLKNPDVIKELEGLVREVFSIGKQDNYSEQVHLELGGLKDQFIEAINRKKLGKIEDFRQIYLSLAESFLESMNECGGGYSYEQAKKEIGNIFEGWSEVQWLDDDLRELLIKSTQTHDEETIREVAYIPAAISIRAIKIRDHFIFQKFLKFIPYFHHLGYREPDKNVRGFIHDRSVAWLKEIANYFIEPELKNAKEETLIKEYADFSTHLFLTFQSLLKTSFDNNDIETLEKIGEALGKLYRHFEPSREYPKAEHLEWELKRATNDEEKMRIESKLKIQKSLEEKERELKLRKSQLFFGFTSWVFHKHRANRGNEKTKQSFNILKKYLPTKIEDLTNIFITSRSFETEDFFGWQWWDVIPDGEVRMLDFHSNLDYLYLILALENIPGSRDQLEKISLPPSRDLTFLIENNGELQKKLTEIETNYHTAWTDFISPDNVSKVSSLRELFQKAKGSQEVNEGEYIKSAVISNNKVEEFYNLFLKGFNEQNTLRNLFTRFKRFSDLSANTELKPEIDLWGYNQIDMKEGFLEKWHVHYVGWGEQYGEGLARSENEAVFEKIADNLIEVKAVKKEEAILQIIEYLKQKQIKNPIIAGSFVDYFELHDLRASDRFVPQWNRQHGSTDLDDLPFYMGYLKYDDIKIPVLRTFSRKPALKNTLIVFSAKDIGEWVQYPPIKTIEDKKKQRDIFFYQIYDLNVVDDQRNKILQRNPDWLQEQASPEDHLRQKVLINIFEKFEFNVLNKNAGCRFIITDAEDEINVIEE